MKHTISTVRNTLILLLLSITALACNVDDDNTALDHDAGHITSNDAGDKPKVVAPGTLQFSYKKPDSQGKTSPADVSSDQLSEGHLKNRQAQLVILKGIVAPGDETVYEVEFVRSVKGELYQDLDIPQESSHWITRAEVRDKDGNVLWSEHVNSLFQSLELLKLLLAQNSGFDFDLRQVYKLISGDYPEVIEFAVRVPTGIEGGIDYVLTIPNADGERVDIGSFPIADLVADAEPVRFEGEVTSLYESGDPKDRIDVVILSDGYTESERGKFELDAQATAQALIDTTPIKEHKDMFNVWAIWTPSNESGAGYDCNFRTQPDCKQGFRDTMYDTVFVIPAIGDKLNLDVSDVSDRVAMPISIGKVFEVAALVPYDEIIVLSNSEKRAGFAGLYVSLVTSWNRNAFPEVAVHEFGHTFGMLGDEYMAPGDPCFYNEPKIPLPANITALPTAENPLKWQAWVKDHTPIPTDPADRLEYPVGAYQDTYNCDFLYRPAEDCKMNNSYEEFCPVCAEQMVRRIYSVIDVTPNEPTTVKELSAKNLRFQVPLRDVSTRQKTEWKIGEDVIGDKDILELSTESINALAQPGEWIELTAEVAETSGFVRQEDPRTQQKFSWWVRVSP